MSLKNSLKLSKSQNPHLQDGIIIVCIHPEVRKLNYTFRNYNLNYTFKSLETVSTQNTLLLLLFFYGEQLLLLFLYGENTIIIFYGENLRYIPLKCE